MERSIVGLKDGKCIYIEQMPNGGEMDCAYTDSARKAVVKYYKDMEAAAVAGESQGVNVTIKDGKTETKYTIDGKQVGNPLQEAVNNGQCVISGYGE